MKLQILHPPHLSYITYVTFDRGYYKVNWSTRHAEFFKGKLKKAEHYWRSNQCLLDMCNLEAILGENAKMVYNCCILDTVHNTYVLEYIEGSVSSHFLSDNVDEVYLSTEAPFNWNFFHHNELHQTFCGKALALKRFSK